MKHPAWMVGLLAVLATAGGAAPREAASSAPPDIESVVRDIRHESPRLFLNREMLEAIARDGLTPEQEAWARELQRRVKGYLPPLRLDEDRAAYLLSDEHGTKYVEGVAARVNEGPWGDYAAQAALAYLLTGERLYYDRAVEFLTHAADVWDLTRAGGRIPEGKAFGRLNGLSAYDWLYEHLPPAQRDTLGRSLFRSLYTFYRRWRPRPEVVQYASVGYIDTLMGWYLGLVFLDRGVPDVGDDQCLEMLRNEYAQYLNLFDTRFTHPDGIIITGAIGYYTQGLPIPFNFLDAWRSAFHDESFARYALHVAYCANYTLWNSIPTREAPFGGSRALLSHGWSDAYHTDNNLGMFHHYPLMRVPDLYAGLKDEIEYETLVALAQLQAPPDPARFLDTYDNWLTPASPLLMTVRKRPQTEIDAALARLPRARNFTDPAGQIFMNSGWSPEDTYALFVAGRQQFSRKHFDENHFSIYKKGFLAMDTGGRRGSPGHIATYYHQTIAHNCVLIRMEGEVEPSLWGENAVISSGGMNKNYGAQVRGFETNDRYTYIASDATRCYHEDKAAAVTRQFLFVYPDYFVVFDRVTSKRPDQKKTWLFHTQHEPVLEGDTFQAEHGEGRVFVRTLLPQAARVETIGGRGKEFWVGDRNWPVAKDWQALPPDKHLFGQWRVEVGSGQEREHEAFLHVIQVGDRAALQTMTGSRLIEEPGRAGVEFQAGAAAVRVLFATGGDMSGHIRVSEEGRPVLDRALAQDVMPQTGLALNP